MWREAYLCDVVCVTPATRAQAKTDNAEAYDHVNESLVSYGPNTCQQGYVWRDGVRLSMFALPSIAAAGINDRRASSVGCEACRLIQVKAHRRPLCLIVSENEDFMTYDELIELARMCLRQSALAQTEDVARELRRMARECQDKAAKLGNGQLPDIRERRGGDQQPAQQQQQPQTKKG